MADSQKISFWQSVRIRLVALLLGLTILSLVITAYLGISALLSASQSAQEASDTIVREQAKSYLLQIIQKTAEQNDLILENIQQDAKYLASYAQDIFENPDRFAEGGYWKAEERMTVGEDGRFINGEDDLVSVYVPAFKTIDEAVITNLNLSAQLDGLFRAIFENNSNIVAVYIGTEQEVTRYYPNINLGALLPADFQVTQRPWYLTAVQNNPSHSVVWSPIYEDSTGKGFLVTTAAPVYTQNNNIIGVIGIDVTLDEISANVAASQLIEGGYSFLIDETGHAITLPEQGYPDILNRNQVTDELGPDLSNPTTNFKPIIKDMLAGATGFESVNINENENFVAYAPLENTGWSLGAVIPSQEVLKSVAVLRDDLEKSTRQLLYWRILPFSAAILVITLFIGFVATRLLVQPLQDLVSAAQRIGVGEWDAPLPKASRNEIGVLSTSFKQMANQLQQTLSNLEQRVADRTKALERRSQQIQTAADVGSVVASIRDLDTLLPQVTNLISRSFGFYHVGIFLLDGKKEYAILSAANSPGGQRMLVRNHRLKVGEEGIVGYVTGSQTPRIALNVGDDAVHFRNPDLPDTKSEVALPLISGGQLLGALDVQSTEEAAFSEEDIAVLQVLADQVAVAIENANLFEQNKMALESAQKLTSELSQKAWEEFLSTKERLGFRIQTSDLLTPTSGEWSSDMIQAAKKGDIVRADDYTIAVPIILRDQVLGVFRLRKNETNGKWTNDEIKLMDTLIDQVESALESARLYTDTQHRAARERLVTEITTKIRGSNDPQVMLQIAVTELRKALQAQRAQVLLQPNINDHPSGDDNH
jgi:GAF domain-containing protein/HAMP domain-containing protein